MTAELDRTLSEHLGAEVRVGRETGTPYQDAGQVSLVGTASLDWCREHLDVDGDRRRIRPNLVVSTTEPFVEEGWGGATIRIGGVELTVVERIERCRMVDIAQEGLAEQRRLAQGPGPRTRPVPRRLRRASRVEPAALARRVIVVDVRAHETLAR